MNKMCKAHLGVLLLALHLLSSQVVQAENATGTPMTTMMSNYTMTPTMTPNMVNVTSKNGSGRLDAVTLLLPLALAAPLLHGWSQ